MRIGIIGAMEVEVTGLKSLLKESGTLKTTNVAGLVFYSGQIFGVDVVVVKSGVGKVNAALCAARLITQFAVTSIINTGIAGALGGGLTVFDVAVSTKAMYHDVNAVAFGYKECEIPQMKTSIFPADSSLIDCANTAFKKVVADSSDTIHKGSKIVAGIVATGDQFISDKSVKNHIKETTNAICVEMEGAAIAHACFLNNTPYVILRTISDMADDSVPQTYQFNEEIAAKFSCSLVVKMVELMGNC